MADRARSLARSGRVGGTGSWVHREERNIDRIGERREVYRRSELKAFVRLETEVLSIPTRSRMWGFPAPRGVFGLAHAPWSKAVVVIRR
jgi:hypothetical protein